MPVIGGICKEYWQRKFRAVVDLALNESPMVLPREMVYCRFPLLDGTGNPAWLLRAAVEAVMGFVRADVATLVCCGAGMSRSPAIAAMALAQFSGESPAQSLAAVTQGGTTDVSPGLWQEMVALWH